MWKRRWCPVGFPCKTINTGVGSITSQVQLLQAATARIKFEKANYLKQTHGYIYTFSWLILVVHPVNERRRYFVTTSLIGWVQAYNQPCITYKVIYLVQYNFIHGLPPTRELLVLTLVLSCAIISCPPRGVCRWWVGGFKCTAPH